jgi:hypothetical protein
VKTALLLPAWPRSALTRAACLLLVLSTTSCGSAERTPAGTLPSTLSNAEFWQLATDWSEPEGSYRSEILISNELLFQHVVPTLIRRVQPGGVYVGVGPEQNFTYIAAVQPSMAVIVDIRRRNLQLHLLYKALFELATDRADFVSRLFAKPRPDGLTAASTVTEIFDAFERSPADERLHRDTETAIVRQLTESRGLPLSMTDREDITSMYRRFYERGFALLVSPTYAELMTQTDMYGVPHSFLATEDRFNVVRTLHLTNRIIPVVGDFAGSETFAKAGAYMRSHRATVSTFYVSNVEQYLHQEGKWRLFCRNVVTLPLDGSSTFVRALPGDRGFLGGFNASFVSRLGRIQEETGECQA